VGNDKRVLVSDLSGQRNIIAKMKEQGIDIPLSREETRALLERRGYTVRTLDVSELQKAESALTCLSILFDAR